MSLVERKSLAEEMLPILNDVVLPIFGLHETLRAEIFVDRVYVAGRLGLLYDCAAGLFILPLPKES